MNENRFETIKGIPVVIPSYEPDEQLVELCEALVTSGITDICIVDDGSGEEYRSIFDRIETTYADENVSFSGSAGAQAGTDRMCDSRFRRSAHAERYLPLYAGARRPSGQSYYGLQAI